MAELLFRNLHFGLQNTAEMGVWGHFDHQSPVVIKQYMHHVELSHYVKETVPENVMY